MGEYEWATPDDSWMMGAPLGRMVAELIVLVLFGEEDVRSGRTDVGGNIAFCVFTFLI